MTLGLPHGNIELRPGEELSPERMAEVLRSIQANFDRLDTQFPLYGENLTAVLKLAAGGNAEIAFGTGTLSFPGASEFVTAKEISHGLETTPTAVIVGSGNASRNVAAATFTKTTFTASARALNGAEPTAPSTFSFYWIALG